MHAAAVLALQRPRIVAWSRMGDEALASRAAAGSQAAFSTLYERYHGPLLGYCRSILLDAEDALDATQSALENALRALPRREPGRPLRPWLYRIAHNEAINIVRRRQPGAAPLDTESLLTVPGPEVDSEQRTRLAQLVDDLRMLPERQRGALVMRELSGLSYDEIGLALGVSNEAARRAVFDARSALHAAVDGRATACTSVRRTLSDGDRRRLRARGLRAHLRSCDDCATFERSMGARQADLHAIGWLGGSAALGLIGIGGGAGGGAIVLAGGSGGAVAGGGLWAGLPVAVKALAVAAVVAATGTAAIEIPKVAAPDSPAPQSRSATTNAAGAPAVPARRDAVRALGQATAARRAQRAGASHRSASLRVRSGGGVPSAAAAPARPAPAVTTQPRRGSQGAPAAAKTPQQIAAENLQRIRAKMMAAFANAQTVAAAGTAGSLEAANSIVQSTLQQVLPSIQRTLASVGMSLPSRTTTPPSARSANPTITNVLAPAQTLVSGLTRRCRTCSAPAEKSANAPTPARVGSTASQPGAAAVLGAAG